MELENSALKLAAKEAANVESRLALLGDTYDLVTIIEGLYDTLPELIHLPLDVATNDAAHAAGINGHLMLVCRRELTVGILTLLRGYRVDLMFHIRKAIEFCAFAAKMKRHPHLSRIWIQSASSDEAWKKFRDKFQKLFPEDDAGLTLLSPLYDVASEAMHSSPKSVAHYLLGGIKARVGYQINAFDLSSEVVFAALFITTVDCHLTILSTFRRDLGQYLNEATAWDSRLHEAKVFYTAKHHQWLHLVRSGIPEAML